MWSRFLQFSEMRMAYVTEGRIILKYKSRSSLLPRNELLLSRFSTETKLFTLQYKSHADFQGVFTKTGTTFMTAISFFFWGMGVGIASAPFPKYICMRYFRGLKFTLMQYILNVGSISSPCCPISPTKEIYFLNKHQCSQEALSNKTNGSWTRT